MSDIDAQGVAIIFIGVVVAGFILTIILPPFLQAIRGPSTDFTINTVIDHEGNVSEYSVTIVLPDTYSYDKFAKCQRRSTFPQLCRNIIPHPT